MRTLVIGDIHGCLAALKTLWRQVDPQLDDRLIFLGDYIDRGPDSKGVIDFLIEVKKTYAKAIFLMGNHEEKLCLATHGGSELAIWLSNWGGQATLQSYTTDTPNGIPAAHWEFLRATRPYYETSSHIFVHANLSANIPLSLQLPYTLLHKKFGKPKPHISGKTMICGHTVIADHKPINLGHAICIDTDPGRGGWLTCLHVETGHYTQANMNGESRASQLARPS